MFTKDLTDHAEKVLSLAKEKGKKLVTAESCTGGLVSGVLTEIPGSSAAFYSGFVTYSNDAKVEMLGVDPLILKENGAVSEETAAYMAVGALEYTDGDISVAITGIAGPEGGSEEKPVGTVWFGVGILKEDEINVHTGKYLYEGDRQQIRLGAVETALHMLETALSEEIE